MHLLSGTLIGQQGSERQEEHEQREVEYDIQSKRRSGWGCGWSDHTGPCRPPEGL